MNSRENIDSSKSRERVLVHSPAWNLESISQDMWTTCAQVPCISGIQHLFCSNLTFLRFFQPSPYRLDFYAMVVARVDDLLLYSFPGFCSCWMDPLSIGSNILWAFSGTRWDSFKWFFKSCLLVLLNIKNSLPRVEDPSLPVCFFASKSLSLLLPGWIWRISGWIKLVRRRKTDIEWFLICRIERNKLWTSLCWWGYDEKGICIYCWWECYLVQPLWKEYGGFSEM